MKKTVTKLICKFGAQLCAVAMVIAPLVSDYFYLFYLFLSNDLFVSGGTDFHGVIKPDISLGTGRGGMRITTGILDNIKAHLF